MINWIPQSKTLKFAVSAAVLSALLYFVGLLAVCREADKIGNLYRDSESEFSKEGRFLAIKSVLETNRETIGSLNSFFIQKDDEVEFIKKIEGIARESSLVFQILSIDVKPIQDDSSNEAINVRMKIDGSWTNILNFVSKLERMPFGVVIEDVNLDTGVAGGWSGLMEFSVFRRK